MNRNVKICREDSVISSFIDLSEDEGIRCAYELSMLCSPDCAACDFNSNSNALTCARGEFCLGYLKE